jgi:hypothetical protein
MQKQQLQHRRHACVASSTPDDTSSSPSRRRATLAAVSAAAVSVFGAASSSTPAADASLGPVNVVQSLTSRGMAKFVQNDVEGSIAGKALAGGLVTWTTLAVITWFFNMLPNRA